MKNLSLLSVTIAIAASWEPTIFVDAAGSLRSSRATSRKLSQKSTKKSKKSKGASTEAPTEVPVDCDNPTSKWEEYVCDIQAGPKLQDQCLPKYLKTSNSVSKGLIVAFHGYTACPDQFDRLRERWLSEGYDVMIPLLVGNGRDSSECSDPASEIYGDYTICAEGYDNITNYRIDGLPVDRQGYIDFVNNINEIVEQEKSTRKISKVFATGLSQGAPVASYAVATGGGIYYGSLSMSPFFGSAIPSMDRDFNECIDDNMGRDVCIQRLMGPYENNPIMAGLKYSLEGNLKESGLTYDDYALAQAEDRVSNSFISDNFDMFVEESLGDALERAEYGWGEQCVKENKNGRGGICKFRVRNMLAAHSFAAFAHRFTGSSHASRAPVQFVITERDSITRNSLVVQAAQNEIRAGNNDVSICMYRIEPGCNITLPGNANECGVPHSMLSAAENTLLPPGNLYWMEALENDSVDFFDNFSPMGTNHSVSGTFTSRSDCVQLDAEKPPPSNLVLPVMRGVWFRIAPNQNTKDLLGRIISGIVPWQVFWSQNPEIFTTSNGEVYWEYYAEVLASSLEEEVITNIESFATTFSEFEVEFAGRQPVGPYTSGSISV